MVPIIERTQILMPELRPFVKGLISMLGSSH